MAKLNTTKENATLFGHPIIQSKKMSLAETIYDIIFTEIFSGRWQPGEKLPSMSYIADQCYSSRMPVQEAVERLGRDGYIRQAPRSGIFLADNLPQKTGMLGTIAILAKSNLNSEEEIDFFTFEQLLIHRLLKQLKEYHYTAQIIYIEDNSELDRVLDAKHLSSEVKGIISLFPFPHTPNHPIKAQSLPLVFWGTPDHRCAPTIASDYELAMYLLTSKVISKGHTKITPIPCLTLTDYVRNRFWNGYRNAMLDAGLTPSEDNYNKLLKFNYKETKELQQFINKDKASAYLCFSLARAEQTISCLDKAGFDIPSQKSVVTSNPTKKVIHNDLLLTGVAFSPEKEIEMCVKHLRELQMKNECTIATSLVIPTLFEGNTLATHN